MKRTAICFFLGLLLLGCQSKQDHYYWQKLKLASGIDKNVLNIRREKRAFPNGYTLEYITAFEREYYLRDTLMNRLIWSRGNEKSVDLDTLIHLETKVFYLQGQPYRIEHFKSQMRAIDEGIDFYWNDELGLLAKRATYWPIYGILQSQDQYQNKKIWALVKAAYPAIKEYIYMRGMLTPELKPGVEHIIDESYWID